MREAIRTRWLIGTMLAVLGVGSCVRGEDPASDSALAEQLGLVLPRVAPAPDGAFAILLTGDGGWAELVREVARQLGDAGLPVIGWNSRIYYWKRRTPEEAARDLGCIIDRFTTSWDRPQVIVVGYSRGADVAPFLVNRLAPEKRARVALVALLGPGRAVEFELHLTDFLYDPAPDKSSPVRPEVEALGRAGVPLLVVHGEREQDSPAPELSPGIARVVKLPGDHHFGRDYVRLARLIVESPRRAQSPRLPP